MAHISIIIPTFNKANTIVRSIESVVGQTFRDWEIIIVDDGSSDNTRLVVGAFLTDTRIKYCFKENEGVSAARNFGVNMSSSPYLIFLDADDWVTNTWLEEFVLTLNVKQVDMVFCLSALKDEVTEEIQNFNSFQSCFNGVGQVDFSNLAGTFLIRTDIFKASGGYRSALRFSENYELVTRILYYKRPEVAYIRKQLVIFGNSVNVAKRNSKFPQSLMRDSFLYLSSINPEFWTDNRMQYNLTIRRLIVANIVLGKYWSALRLVLANVIKQPYYFFRLLLFISAGPMYRRYLISKGFRP